MQSEPLVAQNLPTNRLDGVGVLVTILIIGLLVSFQLSWSTSSLIVLSMQEGIWRLGFIKAASYFRGVYVASNALQLILALFFSGKLVYSATLAAGASRKHNFLE